MLQSYTVIAKLAHKQEVKCPVAFRIEITMVKVSS